MLESKIPTQFCVNVVYLAVRRMLCQSLQPYFADIGMKTAYTRRLPINIGFSFLSNGTKIMPANPEKPIELLIVDDDDELRDTTGRLFARRGFSVSTAANGSAAIDLAQQKEFQVGLFDVNMPGMSGIDLLSRFKQLQPDCQIILLTGTSSSELEAVALERGAFAFATKPYPLKDLEALIRCAYESKHPRQMTGDKTAPELRFKDRTPQVWSAKCLFM